MGARRVGVTVRVGARRVGVTVRVGARRTGVDRGGAWRVGGEKDRVRVGVERGGELVRTPLPLVALRRWLRRSSANRLKQRGRRTRIAVL